ncbi:IQ domain-containing protein K isoform X1 [Pongo abelii]|nr:IQ domain-containing protein K isoform X1 [Pongo abelii]
MLFHGFGAEHYFPVSHFTMISHTPCPQDKSETVNPKTCSPKEYLETFIFPVLLPGMASLLYQAKKEKCFERKRTKFIACDFLTEWLYNQNPKRAGEPFTEFFSIPFVEERLKQHPRPPIPLSLLLTEEEAALYIQSFWRAYVVRCDPEIQELRQWQKKLREAKHIHQRVKIFWAKQEQKGRKRCEVIFKSLSIRTDAGIILKRVCEMQNGGRCGTCSQDENSIILTIAKIMQQSARGKIKVHYKTHINAFNKYILSIKSEP